MELYVFALHKIFCVCVCAYASIRIIYGMVSRTTCDNDKCYEKRVFSTVKRHDMMAFPGRYIRLCALHTLN